MNDELDLLERARESTWPRSLPAPESIRERADRRARTRVTASVTAAACAVVAVSMVAAVLHTGDGGTTVTTGPDRPATTARIDDVTFVLPTDWEVLVMASAGVACFGPPGYDTGQECPVLVAVTADPATAPDGGLDAVPALMDSCDPNDPNLVDVTAGRVNGRATSTYLGRCTADSPVMTAWALNNHTMYVIAADPRWTEEGQFVFENATIPAEWPEAPDGSPSDPPTQPEESGGACIVRLTQDEATQDLPLDGPARVLRLTAGEPIGIQFKGECPADLVVTPATGTDSNLYFQERATSQFTLTRDITHLVLISQPCLEAPGGGYGCRGPNFLLTYDVEVT